MSYLLTMYYIYRLMRYDIMRFLKAESNLLLEGRVYTMRDLSASRILHYATLGCIIGHSTSIT